MKDKQYSISVISPVYNEEKNVEEVILHTMKTFQQLNVDFEIIIVDDCSVDQTGEIAESLARNYPEISCIHHEKNSGIGGAFKTGTNHATKEYVMLVPVDSPLDPEDLQSYLPRMEVCDIVVGVRAERVGYNGIYRSASFVYNE